MQLRRDFENLTLSQGKPVCKQSKADTLCLGRLTVSRNHSLEYKNPDVYKIKTLFLAYFFDTKPDQ